MLHKCTQKRILENKNHPLTLSQASGTLGYTGHNTPDAASVAYRHTSSPRAAADIGPSPAVGSENNDAAADVDAEEEEEEGARSIFVDLRRVPPTSQSLSPSSLLPPPPLLLSSLLL